MRYLKAIGEQQEERQEEMAEQQEHTYPEPIAVFADVIPEGLFRDIGIPDQEILGKADVGPEDRESEHQHADTVHVVLVKDALKVSTIVEPDCDNHPYPERTAHAVGEKPDTIHGREPVIF